MKERHFEMIETDGAVLRTVVEGEGPLVILLHGWPQCWYLWRHQIDPLVNAGYRVAVPDQRGYGGSSSPAEVSEYDIRKLTADVDGIRAALGYDYIQTHWSRLGLRRCLEYGIAVREHL